MLQRLLYCLSRTDAAVVTVSASEVASLRLTLAVYRVPLVAVASESPARLVWDTAVAAEQEHLLHQTAEAVGQGPVAVSVESAEDVDLDAVGRLVVLASVVPLTVRVATGEGYPTAAFQLPFERHFVSLAVAAETQDR